MKSMSFVELIAVSFAAIAGLASGVQAYVSWETRGEVSRAIVFAQRLDACARVLASIEPFVAKARADGRATVAKGSASGRYSLPGYYYGQSSGNAAFRQQHDPRVDAWRGAAAALRIVTDGSALQRVAFFDRVIVTDIPAGIFMSQDEMLALLKEMDVQAEGLAKDCRALL